MPEKVLFVDDESAILSGFKRLLRYESLKLEHPAFPEFTIDTATSGDAGLASIREKGPYAVIVSDLRMPGMDGVRFLQEARNIAPASVRMMLTGQGDVTTAIDAVNRGAIFRFLTKPCPSETLVAALQAALQQYQLVMAERQLLDQTLAGSVKVLTEVLSLVNPTASSRALRVRGVVEHIVKRLRLKDAWQMEVAALLSQLGYLTLGVDSPEREGTDAKRPSDAHSAAARDLLVHIPRLEQVAAIVGGQQDEFNPRDAMVPLEKRDRVKLGAQILRVALDFDASTCSGLTPDAALSRLRMKSGHYDPVILDALSDFVQPTSDYVPRRVAAAELRQGMLLDQDVRNAAGLLFVAKGHEITLPLLIRLKTLVATGQIDKTFSVLTRAD
jgi:CheY-like chemotaxis protein